MSRPQTIRGKDDSGKLGHSRPIEIRAERRTGTDKGRGYAASAPVLRPLPPPPPSTRPQIPSVEPPPLDLPPSPSTFSDELKDGSPEETGGVAVVSATAKNADRATRNYARSLMLSSSMPTTSFLDSYKWQTVREDPESPALYDDDTKEDGEDEEKTDESPTNANISPVHETRAKSGSVSGRGRLNSTAEETGAGSVTGRRPINIAQSASTADDLSKSPTVLSLLQSNSFTNSPQVQYRSSRATHMNTRASVMAQAKDDDEEDSTPAEDNTNDDLQFSISLNENDDSYLDAGDEAFS